MRSRNIQNSRTTLDDEEKIVKNYRWVEHVDLSLQKLREIIEELVILPEAKRFSQPVDSSMTSSYDVIKHPMDFQTILRGLWARKYPNVRDVLLDVCQIWENCYLKNENNPPASAQAKKLSKWFEKIVRRHARVVSETRRQSLELHAISGRHEDKKTGLPKSHLQMPQSILPCSLNIRTLAEWHSKNLNSRSIDGVTRKRTLRSASNKASKTDPVPAKISLSKQASPSVICVKETSEQENVKTLERTYSLAQQRSMGEQIALLPPSSLLELIYLLKNEDVKIQLEDTTPNVPPGYVSVDLTSLPKRSVSRVWKFLTSVEEARCFLKLDDRASYEDSSDHLDCSVVQECVS